MEYYIMDQWCLASVCMVNAICFGSFAYKNFKEMRDDGAKVLPALYWSTASACAVGLTAICATEGLEKLLK
jgi:hypothetical protein